MAVVCCGCAHVSVRQPQSRNTSTYLTAWRQCGRETLLDETSARTNRRLKSRLVAVWCERSAAESGARSLVCGGCDKRRDVPFTRSSITPAHRRPARQYAEARQTRLDLLSVIRAGNGPPTTSNIPPTSGRERAGQRQREREIACRSTAATIGRPGSRQVYR